MNPHLRYASMSASHEGDSGSPSGIVEFKDVYYLLDAVRIVALSGALSEFEIANVRSWMRAFLLWVETSVQGLDQERRPDSQGTMRDLLVVSVGAYVEHAPAIVSALMRTRERLLVQFDAVGAQRLELAQTNPRHACVQNLQAWVSIARIADLFGNDLWAYTASDGRGIGRGLEWLLQAFDAGEWPRENIESFDADRLLPLKRDLEQHYRSTSDRRTRSFCGRALFHPATGIAPYWMLARA